MSSKNIQQEFHDNLATKGIGAKDWANSFTEVEYLGNGKFTASISEHMVFKDIDGQWKKHKIVDECLTKGSILIQSAQCCIEVYPFYITYFDVNHKEVRVQEERWVVQRLFKTPDTWRDIDAYNPKIEFKELEESCEVTITYDTDYGILVVKYLQRDGCPLKHIIILKNNTNITEIFRVQQRWSGIASTTVESKGKKYLITKKESILSDNFIFGDDKNSFIQENLSSMVKEKIGETILNKTPGGLRADFVYGNWTLSQNESLEIDPDTATIVPPTIDWQMQWYQTGGSDVWVRNPNANYIEMFASAYPAKYRGVVEWDITSIPAGSTITDTDFIYQGVANTGDCHITAISSQPSIQPDDDTGNSLIWTEIGTGTTYADPAGFPVVGTNQTVDLGATADSNLQSSLSVGWFAIGVLLDTETSGDSFFRSSEYATANPKPTLSVTYIAGVAYTPPVIMGDGITWIIH